MSRWISRCEQSTYGAARSTMSANRPAAVRSLVLGAAGDVDSRRARRGRQARRRRRRGRDASRRCRNCPAWCGDGRAAAPSWLASALPSSATSRARCGGRKLSGGAEAKAMRARRAPARCRWRRPSPRDRWRADRDHAGDMPMHHDLMVEQFDPGRGAGAAGPQATSWRRCRHRTAPPARSRRARPRRRARWRRATGPST